ncbi:hypothetical protein Bca4012_065246 [Brassica carinata]
MEGTEVAEYQAMYKSELAINTTKVETGGLSGWMMATKTFRSTSLLEKFDKNLISASLVSSAESVTYDIGKVVISSSFFQSLSVDEDIVDVTEDGETLEEGEIRNMVKAKDRKGGTQTKGTKKGYQLGRSKDLRAMNMKAGIVTRILTTIVLVVSGFVGDLVNISISKGSSKKVLGPDEIEPNQSAFVKGRMILENVLLETELVNGYYLPNITDCCTIKLDILKAFDTVKWGFITSVIQAMRLLVNSVELEGLFTSALGIRQGGSLCPYLYVIMDNDLSGMLNQAAVDGHFGYHPQCQQVKFHISALLTIILVLADGYVCSLDGVLEVMHQFAGLSGLQINVTKSSIFAA